MPRSGIQPVEAAPPAKSTRLRTGTSRQPTAKAASQSSTKAKKQGGGSKRGGGRVARAPRSIDSKADTRAPNDE